MTTPPPDEEIELVDGTKWHHDFINLLCGAQILHRETIEYACLECGMHPLTLKEAEEHDCK